MDAGSGDACASSHAKCKTKAFCGLTDMGKFQRATLKGEMGLGRDKAMIHVIV